MALFKTIRSTYKTIRSAIPAPFIAVGGMVGGAISVVEQIYAFLVKHNWIDGQNGETMSELFNVPYWAWGLIFLLGYFFIWFLIYGHKLRIQIEEGHKEIAELREKGVAIRNKGSNKFATDEECLAWQKEALDWNEKTIQALKKINVPIGIWFTTLDVVPNPRIDTTSTNCAHLKLFREHDRRLDNLGHLIRDLWGIGKVSE